MEVQCSGLGARGSGLRAQGSGLGGQGSGLGGQGSGLRAQGSGVRAQGAERPNDPNDPNDYSVVFCVSVKSAARLTRSPLKTTSEMRSVAVMSVSGFPSTISRSAS
jgi:hypothetical protein